MQQLTEEDLVTRGIRASELLSNETFAMALKDLVDYHLSAFLNSTPGEEKLREAAYYQTSAIQQVTGLLQQWVAIKEQIIANNEDPVEE